MAVAAPPAEAEIEGTAESERRQSRLRLLRQRPRLKAGAAERELGSLNADQTDFPPVGEREGIAVDHRDRLGTRGEVEVQSLCTVRRRVAQRLADRRGQRRSEEHTSELQSLMRISYAVFCLKKK